MSRRAAVVGVGLIGGSIGLGLRARGWHVTGRDRDRERAARGLELGALDAVGDDPDAEITFVATPVGDVARYQLHGDLTFHGVTRQVEDEVSVDAPNPDTLVIEGEHVFDVRDFGVRPPRLGLLRVHPEVSVTISVEAERTADS